MADFNLRSFLKPYHGLIFFATVSNIIFTALALTLPWMLKIAIDRVLPTADYGLFFILCGAMLTTYSVRCVVRYIAGVLGSYMVYRVMVDVRFKLFRHLQSLSLRFYEEYRTGKVVSNVISDVGLLQQFVSSIVSMADQIVMLLLISILLLFLNWQLGLMVLAIAPLHFINFAYFRKKLKITSKSFQERMSEISANLAETINGIKVVKSFGQERNECMGFFKCLRPTLPLGVRLNLLGNICGSVADMLSICTYLLVIGVGIRFVQQQVMTIGEFVAFYSYVGTLLGPISIFATLSMTISQGLAGAERIAKLMRIIPEIQDVSDPIKPDKLEGKIVFDNVTFKYDEQPVIKELDLTIEPGKKIALVGPSGCGKTTLGNLILRFYDVTSGRILIDGIDIRKYAKDSFRNNVAVVLQEPFLFSGTIKENIAYAKKDATNEEIYTAAKMANVEEFVNMLPHGYKTVIGENGASLSGGQKQRIAIARAILKNPSILILDEATSALDTVSEYLVQQALDNLMEGRTTIIIAHRLSTIKNADTIVVLKSGKIDEIGTHDELMQGNGTYHDLYTIQQKTALEGAADTIVDESGKAVQK